MSAPPAYAPTATTSYTPASQNGHVRYHEEVSRASFVPTSIHKAVYDSFCELYLILAVAQMVESAFVKDYVTDKDKYTATIVRLVSQSQVLLESVRASPTHEQIVAEILPKVCPDHSNLLAELAAKYNLDAPLAVDRLTKQVPATLEHLHTQVERAGNSSTANSGNGNQISTKLAAASARLVAEATGNFITLMDALKLNYNTKTQLHPLLSALVLSLNELVTRENTEAVAFEFPGKLKLVSWLITLNNLAETEVLSADDTERFLQDLDASYRGFYDSLE